MHHSYTWQIVNARFRALEKFCDVYPQTFRPLHQETGLLSAAPSWCTLQGGGHFESDAVA